MGEAGEPVLIAFVEVIAGGLGFVACWNLFKALSR